MNELDVYLKRIRLEAGFESQEKFAGIFPQSHDWVQKRESGMVQISLEDFLAWCNKCNVTLEKAASEIPDEVKELERADKKRKLKQRLKELTKISIDEMSDEELEYLSEICDRTDGYKRK